jgi:phospholipid transport system substrate-binding protein
MQRLSSSTLAASLTALALVATGAWAQSPTAPAAAVRPDPRLAPDALVLALSNQVLDAIRADKALQAGDLVRLNRLVDEIIMPHVNFEKMTRLAVGRGWREATPAQREALVREFRILLVRTYSGAVSEVRDHRIVLRPFRMAPSSDTDVIVRTSAVPSRGEAIQIDYRLEKTDAAWKIYDLNILGIWLVESYRHSFAAEIGRGGIDGLIRSLAERNRAPDTKKA